MVAANHGGGDGKDGVPRKKVMALNQGGRAMTMASSNEGVTVGRRIGEDGCGTQREMTMADRGDGEAMAMMDRYRQH